MTKPDHKIGVQEAQIVKRAKLLKHDPGEGINRKPVYSLVEACRTEFEHDAHFFCYHTDDPIIEIPPLAKNVLPLIREKGRDLVTETLALDIDTEGHRRWTPETFEAFRQCLLQARSDIPAPTIFYTTRNGARFIYALTESIPVDQSEPIHRGLTDLLSRHINGPIHVDTKCFNWDRVFRLPRVVRDKFNTWEEPFFKYHEDLTALLDPASITPLGPTQTRPTAALDLPDIDKPTPEEVTGYLKDGNKQSIWYKIAKKYLKGRDCFKAIFGEGAIAREGERDSTIQAYAGQVCALLSDHVEATPEKCYALLHGSVEILRPDQDTPDWTDILWTAILKYWTKEEERRRIEKEEKEQEEQKKEDKLDAIIQRMQTWCDHPELHQEKPELRRYFALNHFIVMTTNEYYIMGEHGYYHPIGTGKIVELPAVIARLGMDDLINLVYTRNGTQALVPGTDLLARHGTKVKEMVGKISAEGLHIESLGLETARLVTNLFRRRKDLEHTAAFHPEVDRWLRSLVPPDQYPNLEAWLSWSLAFDEGPICALSLAGPPGCGKKLLVQGLAECVDSGEIATAREFGRFRETLLRTCFLAVDEGLPKPQQGAPDVADTFRHFVSGDPLQIETKYRTPITIKNPVRIIFTANNADIIQQLAGHRELTLEDQEALALRIMHLEAQQDATEYLLSLGGIHHTKGWIGGDSGEQSDYIVARHFMWLYLNKRREYPRQRRFLVEGCLDSDLITEMKLRAGISPQIVETLINMIESDEPRKIRGMVIEQEKGLVHITNQGVADRFKVLFSQYRLNGHSLRKVLNGITVSAEKCRKDLSTGKQSDNLIWRSLDLKLLLDEAVKNGMSHTRLAKLYNRQLNREDFEDYVEP